MANERPRSFLIDDYVLTAMFAHLMGNSKGVLRFLDRAIELCNEVKDERLASLTALREEHAAKIPVESSVS